MSPAFRRKVQRYFKNGQREDLLIVVFDILREHAGWKKERDTRDPVVPLGDLSLIARTYYAVGAAKGAGEFLRWWARIGISPAGVVYPASFPVDR